MAGTSTDFVDRVMTRTVRTAAGTSLVSDAVRLMAEMDIGSLVVTAGGRAVGVVTERDVVKELARDGAASLRKRLDSVASKPVISVSPTTELWEAFALMLKKKIRRLPVVERGKVVGIVTERDLLKWVVGVFYEPNIPSDIKKLIAQNP